LRAITTELSNIRAAWDYVYQQIEQKEEPKIDEQAAWTLIRTALQSYMTFLTIRGFNQEGLQTTARILDVLLPRNDLVFTLQVFAQRAELYYQMSNFKECENTCEQAIVWL
ncbi:MAG: hypothetical protein AAF335_05050, partial [Bacteroidota bacterium]